ncbi:MAG: RNA-directed DNA polymerase [Candidatus Hydrogenedentes bacterium]|nr:RNA-directed DNA polymerase [Candidatus Hydrogenedentota bacterium]
MAFWSWLTGGGRAPGELAERIGLPLADLEAVKVAYHTFTLPKRGGGTRTISAPDPELKAAQRQIYQRLLKRLPVHPCVTGFRPGYSIASNAACHAGRAAVIRMDIRDFFGSTDAKRVRRYLQRMGWNRAAAKLLARICTHEGGLPQGAPTSPALSNAVNYRLDARLDGLARKHGAVYTRYADDLTFSLAEDRHNDIQAILYHTKRIVAEEGGYKLHQKKKLRIRRRHQQQQVTGLVVNERVALPRATRRWLRAVDHRLRAGSGATLTPQQRQGWAALEQMVAAHQPPRSDPA